MFIGARKMFNNRDLQGNVRFQPFDHKVWLASPTMHCEELEYVKEAYDTNWMSTVAWMNFRKLLISLMEPCLSLAPVLSS